VLMSTASFERRDRHDLDFEGVSPPIMASIFRCHRRRDRQPSRGRGIEDSNSRYLRRIRHGLTGEWETRVRTGPNGVG